VFTAEGCSQANLGSAAVSAKPGRSHIGPSKRVVEPLRRHIPDTPVHDVTAIVARKSCCVFHCHYHALGRFILLCLWHFMRDPRPRNTRGVSPALLDGTCDDGKDVLRIRANKLIVSTTTTRITASITAYSAMCFVSPPATHLMFGGVSPF